jgi:hypothetical protein
VTEIYFADVRAFQNDIGLKDWFWIKAHRDTVRRYDTTWS